MTAPTLAPPPVIQPPLEPLEFASAEAAPPDIERALRSSLMLSTSQMKSAVSVGFN